MKNFYLLPLLIFFIGCSVDNEELLVSENELQALELQADLLTTTVETTSPITCGTATYPFSEYGYLTITHDGSNVYVTITAREGYDLVDIKFDLVSGEDSFPLVGNGNLPPGKMEHKFTLETGTDSFTFPAFGFADDLFGTYISIASKTTFTDGVSNFSSWVGPIKGNSGDWSYLQYKIETCCEMANAGKDFTRVIEEATYESSIGYAAKLRSYLLDQIKLEDPTASLSGTFEPTAGILDQTYNDWSGQGGGDANLPMEIDDQGRLVLKTTYTVGEGSCADTADIILYIVPTTTSS